MFLSTIFVDFIFVDFYKILDIFIYLFGIFLGELYSADPAFVVRYVLSKLSFSPLEKV
jgi:hypothetical protein